MIFLGEALRGLVALSALPLVANGSRDPENGPFGWATRSGSEGFEVGSTSVEVVDTARSSDGEGTAVKTQSVVSEIFLQTTLWVSTRIKLGGFPGGRQGKRYALILTRPVLSLHDNGPTAVAVVSIQMQTPS